MLGISHNITNINVDSKFKHVDVLQSNYERICFNIILKLTKHCDKALCGSC
jgi:hypothetical protein